MSSSASGLVQVLLMRALPTPLTYRVPQGMILQKGSIVQVPLGRQQQVGVVWAMDADMPSKPVSSGNKPFIIKEITHQYPYPPILPALQQFITWIADYTLSEAGSVLKMVLSVPKALEQPKLPIGYHRAPDPPFVRLTPARRTVLSYIERHPGASVSQIKAETGVSMAVIKGLVDQQLLYSQKVIQEASLEAAVLQPTPPALSEAQQQAADTLCQKIQAGGYSTTVLDGVTGSGKTEVYFTAIEEACKLPGAQVLVLLPEIILTSQWVKRFKERFGIQPVEWHSGLTPAKRVETWRDITSGKARIIVGARSALFLPYAYLKLIIVDEEHDGSFKQEEGVLYHGRDMAVVRGYIEKIPVILASATPSIETVQNVTLGKYQLLTLPGRFNASLPTTDIVDMRRSERQGSPWISKPLGEQITVHLAQKHQVLLFLNRRGYAPLTLCKQCGHRFQCSSCTGWLVRHESPPRLLCHQCGHQRAIPDMCPECQATEALIACGPGIQRIAEAVHKEWPHAKIALMDSDHLTSDAKRDQMIHDITAGHVDIIIGTQVIAKGHHFPKLALVGIIDADVGLSGGDLRAAERCFQLLHQVSGRAGREKTKGHVFIQSYMPDSSVIRALAAGDRDAFVASELVSRQMALMPPFSRLIGLIVSGSHKESVEAAARELVRHLPATEPIEVFGPVPAPFFIIRKQYRYRILLKAPLNIHLQRWLAGCLATYVLPRTVTLKMDVDPYNFA